MAKAPAKKPATKPATKAAPNAKAATKTKGATKAKPKPPTDWAAVLRTGADGVKKWNKLTSKQRGAAALAGADLSGAALAGADLRDVRAGKADFTGADLKGAKLSGHFGQAKFANADLTGARLANVHAPEADFAGAKLIGADLNGAGLQTASLAGADLGGAKLTAAIVTGADLGGANLSGADLTGARFDARTKWPAGFVPPGELQWEGKGADPRLVGKGKRAEAHDINGLMTRLHANIDPKRMTRTLDMLKKERTQLFSVVEPTMVRGIVKSQRDIDTVYSCVLTEDGTYSCGTPDMEKCMGLSNEPCKHLLVLLIGLARAGMLDPATADRWVVAANGKNPRWSKAVQNHIADSFLKYKGAQAGEIDWRPTETIPEDFYAM